MSVALRHWSSRLPFYYGWLVVGIAFVTMAIAVTGRTVFSLLLPPLLAEFGWDRGLTAGAFSFGFLVSAVVGPLFGRVMDRQGPRVVIGIGVGLLSAGLLLAQFIHHAWQLYATLGVLVSGGASLMTYTAHSQFLPHWFLRRRGLAVSIAFSGAGAGAIVLLPWMQTIIVRDGWRASCTTLGLLVLVIIGPMARPTPTARMNTAARPASSTPPGPRSTGPWRARCAPAASGGSRWDTSARCSPGTPCRCTRRNT
jgi:MFS family permease